ncbi:MAG: hypothetical protein DLM57_06280 [Pseudonocardiales bacterium]|nr:MAG: hypothetical protein DLM57_06280 [Pseudonocardiales bacterium]
MSKFSRKKIVAVLVGVGVVAVGGGLAFAYWTSSGTGTGTAGTGTGASTLVITQTSVISGMAPGVAAQTISGTVANNATNSAFVTSVTVSISGVTKAAGAPAGTCAAADYTLSGATMPVNVDVAAGTSTNFTGATIAFNNTGSNQDGCKGATVALAYTSN